MLEGETILVGRKDQGGYLFLWSGPSIYPALKAAWGFLLKFISSHPKQETITSIYLDNLCVGQAGCVSELRMCAS